MGIEFSIRFDLRELAGMNRSSLLKAKSYYQRIITMFESIGDRQGAAYAKAKLRLIKETLNQRSGIHATIRTNSRSAFSIEQEAERLMREADELVEDIESGRWFNFSF